VKDIGRVDVFKSSEDLPQRREGQVRRLREPREAESEEDREGQRQGRVTW
jgi:hypothetical protein